MKHTPHHTAQWSFCHGADRMIGGEDLTPLLDGRFEKANFDKAYLLFANPPTCSTIGKVESAPASPGACPTLVLIAQSNDKSRPKTIKSGRQLTRSMESVAFGSPASKCVPAVDAKWPPAENPKIPMRLGLSFHVLALARAM